MTNLEKYDKVFRRVLKKEQDELKDLRYRGVPSWDSLGHMNLIGELEEMFDVMLETPDMLAFSSYEKGKEILKKYGVVIQ
ncbi:MAG TPA: acyl carrier protein [Candidatus Anaerostipes avistercoris]|uniref:Acyl carrier protein n=1 Tax=Candidatus Anaerostipes avistercoris TaxID=2838462 RepID=A0A9D2PEZ7_9FIRM|nr:acyl carrier protein [Candidatus Anaerostipes avistercoris]